MIAGTFERYSKSMPLHRVLALHFIGPGKCREKIKLKHRVSILFAPYSPIKYIIAPSWGTDLTLLLRTNARFVIRL